MNENQRLRRVALLCAHFMRNLAYYRAGWGDGALKKKTEFWITVNGNFYDICVLEWCKLFADKNDKHCWLKLIEDKESFKTALLENIDLNENEFENYATSMRKYRDKFVAHLDSEYTAQLPRLEIADKAVEYYYTQLVDLNGKMEFLGTLPRDIIAYKNQCKAAGVEVYS